MVLCFAFCTVGYFGVTAGIKLALLFAQKSPQSRLLLKQKNRLLHHLRKER